MRILTIAFTTVLLLVLSGCGESNNSERDKDCPGCDFSHANLSGANLTGALLASANLSRANLTQADLNGAILDGVIGADFTGALNVPERYLKD